MKHIIRKQVIELIMSRQLDAFHIQQQMSRLNENSILPALDKLFTELSNEGQTISLNKLEIDLGIIHPTELEKSNLGQPFIEILIEKVREKIKQAYVDQAIVEVMETEHRARQWFFFLEKGYLPWNGIQMDDAFLQDVLESLAVDYPMISRLRVLLNEKPAIATRIVFQHKPLFIVRLLGILTSKKQDEIPELLLEISNLEEWMRSKGHSVQEFLPGRNNWLEHNYVQVLLIASREAPGINSHTLVKKAMEAELEMFLRKKKIPQKVLETLKRTRALVEEIMTEIVRDGKNIETADEKKDMRSRKKPASQDEKIKHGSKPGKPNDDDSRSRVTEKQGIEDIDPAHKTRKEEGTDLQTRQKEKETIDPEGMYVELAGLVLLHPFLAQFFRRMELLKGMDFMHDAARLKSVYLLFFLATGKTEAPEELLVMPKVLCGVPLKEPMERKFEIKAAEAEECVDLLRAVISQWSILQETSVEGLRESFLQRNGKVLYKDDSIYVQVEARAFDMLLDHLPWNLSMIKLPWKEELIRVEWR